ncbi:MAG: hypothetical protein BGO45_00025 [Microbacterium sp. 71-36]|nr:MULTISPECIES: hypothetical protein [unclassified Microbacterium]MBN9212778.1 hypothetical protein [Microbacterium sp.]ODT38627.1 MAG: hypothetical protein ABS60_09930 [Microbacterium sp. SCN 71-17]ODU52758.1 MAG: hypothetical protein ABT07_00540 [Microbacterium sp. SCN 70-10]OJV76002.1 MAG: hypothetical protein BGO45_00025 [Microbacterium sp. 71-36]
MDIVTPKSAARGEKSRTSFYRSAKSGGWERIARGLYLPVDSSAADWDQLEASARRPEATICLVSALAYHDLTDTIPQALDVAIPRGTRTPASAAAIDWHQFDAATFDLERENIAIPGSAQKIGIYTPERTIADCFRLRASTGYEIPRDALKEWLRRGGKPAKLMKIARALPRSTKPVLDALEILA